MGVLEGLTKRLGSKSQPAVPQVLCFIDSTSIPPSEKPPFGGLHVFSDICSFPEPSK